MSVTFKPKKKKKLSSRHPDLADHQQIYHQRFKTCSRQLSSAGSMVVMRFRKDWFSGAEGGSKCNRQSRQIGYRLQQHVRTYGLTSL